MCVGLAATAATAAVAAARAPAHAGTPALAFRIDQGREINLFLRRGEVAAHLVLTAAPAPRMLVAFPAGDSGVAVWFQPVREPVTWTVVRAPHAVVLHDAEGRALRGIEAEMAASVPELHIEQAVLSSIRVIRRYARSGTCPAQILTVPVLRGRALTWARDRLDGAAGYRLTLAVLDGGTIRSGGDRGSRRALTLAAGPSRQLRIELIAVTGERPLTALAGASLLAPEAQRDPRERDVLEFLSYREKLLAGSWRFDTYFGRDTLMSLLLLGPVLEPGAVESALRSVLARLSPAGKVAHEEAIGEFAILEHLAAGQGPSAQPIYDYGMIDESFMLAPAAARWMLDTPAGRTAAAAFLASPDGARPHASPDASANGTSPNGRRPHGAGEKAGSALVRNLLWVVHRAAPFAARPAVANLIGLEPGRSAGDWRDSAHGLGGGRYPYDVNAVLVPVALRATCRLARSGLLGLPGSSGSSGGSPASLSASPPVGSSADAVLATLMRACGEWQVWSKRAPEYFEVRIPRARARGDISSYARSIGVSAAGAIQSLGPRPLAFEALSLDASGRPIPVMQSDVGFALLLETPPARAVERMLEILRPFPAGLMTPAGLLVANPAFAGRRVEALFTRSDYHGTVIWSWQQALLAAGLAHQLARTDLAPGLRAEVEAASRRLWGAIDGTRSFRSSELWSWSYAGGRYRAEPFARGRGDATEADAAQLWSTVYLAIPPPGSASNGSGNQGGGRSILIK